MKFQIKNRFSGHVKFECELSAEVAGQRYGLQLGFALSKAIEAKVNMQEADLSSIETVPYQFAGATFADATFARATFADATFARATFAGATFARATFARATFARATFADATFARATFAGATFARATFAGATFAGATFARATFARATFARATFADATFAGATFADATGLQLPAAYLRLVRDDLWAVLSAAPREAQGLRDALAAGRVDGSTYEGECACLVGTIANVRGVSHRELDNIEPNAGRPIESFFMNIRRGNLPENNPYAKQALEWTDQWLATMRAAFGNTQ